jgi:hypothetical protein
MNREVATHMALCDIYQRVKAEHQLLQVPVWKCKEISMDFIVGYDSIE